MENESAAAVVAEPELLIVLSELNRHRHFDGLDDVDLFRIMNTQTAIKAAQLLPRSAAQLRQDVLAAALGQFKRGGYFVEFGATDGVYLSNTLLLEREFGWHGILAEPARFWHKPLAEQRSARIDTRCVYTETGKEILFCEVTSDQALSTIVDHKDSDLHRLTRRRSDEYAVETVSLKDLLAQHNAPRHIDYLSLDTEGSEFAILEHFDFDAYEFGLITCEHNYTPSRNAILNLLRDNGYLRILNGISLFDDWYIHESRRSVISEALPGWEAVSHQDIIESGPAQTEKDRMISLLQETVENLIVERDAYKNAFEDHLERAAQAAHQTTE